MKEIRILNKKIFKDILKIHKISLSEDIDKFKNIFVISILDIDTNDKPLTNSENVLVLQFSDIDMHKTKIIQDKSKELDLEFEKIVNSGTIKIFDDDDAKLIINFLNKIKQLNDYSLIIHCTAGISRSGAVGRFASEYLNCSNVYSSNFIIPNIFIYNKLRGHDEANNRH